jgi:hypothetical protein
MNCKDKLRFDSFLLANRYLINLKNINNSDINAKRVYNCFICKGWHLTKQLKKQKLPVFDPARHIPILPSRKTAR